MLRRLVEALAVPLLKPSLVTAARSTTVWAPVAACPLTGAPLAADQCRPNPSVLRVNSTTVLYLPRDSSVPTYCAVGDPIHGTLNLTACRRLKACVSHSNTCRYRFGLPLLACRVQPLPAHATSHVLYLLCLQAILRAHGHAPLRLPECCLVQAYELSETLCVGPPLLLIAGADAADVDAMEAEEQAMAALCQVLRTPEMARGWF